MNVEQIENAKIIMRVLMTITLLLGFILIVIKLMDVFEKRRGHLELSEADVLEFATGLKMRQSGDWNFHATPDQFIKMLIFLEETGYNPLIKVFNDDYYESIDQYISSRSSIKHPRLSMRPHKFSIGLAGIDDNVVKEVYTVKAKTSHNKLRLREFRAERAITNAKESLASKP